MPSPTTPPNSKPEQDSFDADAGRLLTAAERIMQAIAADPLIDLGRVTDLLALQMLGPCLNRAMGLDGNDLIAANNNLIEMSTLIDVQALRRLLRMKGSEKS